MFASSIRRLASFTAGLMLISPVYASTNYIEKGAAYTKGLQAVNLTTWRIDQDKDDFGRPTNKVTLYSVATPRKPLNFPFNKSKGYFTIKENCTAGFFYIKGTKYVNEFNVNIPYLIDGKDGSFVSSVTNGTSVMVQDQEMKKLLNVLRNGKKSFEIVLETNGYGKAHLTWALDGFEKSLIKACPNLK